MKKIILLLVIGAAVAGCRDKYVSPAASPTTGYLVVDGYINTGGTTTITLSRTTKLADAAILYEKKATVIIQGQSGTSYPLTETANGIYTGTPTLPLNTNYRLRIVTAAGKEYFSEYTSPKTTPAIDSVTWKQSTEGVQVSIHAKATPLQEKYYHWRAEETYEYHTDYSSIYKWALNARGEVVSVKFYDPVNHSYDQTTAKCWRTDYTNSILLGNTENLSDNIIHEPLFTIPSGSIKISVLYSVNIKQYSVGKECFAFLKKMKSNTEQLGTIFDAQPSEIKGNITCTTTPGEPVIGFVEASQEQQQRIFIGILQVLSGPGGWNYRSGCEPLFVDLSAGASVAGFDTADQPLLYTGGSVTLIKAGCVDCTKRGGNTQKPAFWP